MGSEIIGTFISDLTFKQDVVFANMLSSAQHVSWH